MGSHYVYESISPQQLQSLFKVFHHMWNTALKKALVQCHDGNCKLIRLSSIFVIVIICVDNTLNIYANITSSSVIFMHTCSYYPATFCNFHKQFNKSKSPPEINAHISYIFSLITVKFCVNILK